MRTTGKHDHNQASRGFSLIELVIVVVIIGIIGAIAIPRLSRGSEGAADAALQGNLSALRSAIDHYAAEHNGRYPTFEVFEEQLLQYTNLNGNHSATKTGDYIYGPYLRKIPPIPVGPEAGETAVTDALGEAGSGWFYDDGNGTITANTTTEKDAKGKLYSDY